MINWRNCFSNGLYEGCITTKNCQKLGFVVNKWTFKMFFEHKFNVYLLKCTKVSMSKY